MRTGKTHPIVEKIISKIYDSSHKWESDLWIFKWIALLVIIIDFHLINSTPDSKIAIIISTEYLYFFYALWVTISLRKKLSFNIQIFNLMVDLLFFTLLQYLSLSMFAESSRLFVLYIILVIYCSYWFKWTFILIFVTMVSSTYFMLNYSILLTNEIEFIIISEIKGTLAPVVTVYFLVTFLVIFVKRIVLKYLVYIDQDLKKSAEKLEQEKEYTRSLLKDKIDGFITIDEKGYVVEVNKLACELFGYEKKEIYKKNIKKIYAADEAARMVRALRERPDGTIENFRTFVINKKEKEKIPVLVSAAFLYDRENLDLKKELAKGIKFPSLGYFRDLRAEEVIDRIEKEITFLKNEKDLFNIITAYISKIIKAEVCSILIYDGAINRLEIRASFGMPYIPRDLTIPKQEQKKYEELDGMDGYVFSTGKTLNVKNIDIPNKEIEPVNNTSNNINVKWNNVRNFAEFSKYKDFLHYLAAPLIIKGEVYGVIKVLNKYSNENGLDKRGFQDKDQRLLERISNQVSILVEKFRNKERFESISKIGMELNERVDLPIDDFLDLVAREAVYGMRFTACFIYIVEDGNKLKIRACKGLVGNYARNENYTLDLGEGLSGSVAKTGSHRMISSTIQKEKEFKDADILTKENLKSILSVPINYENKVFGVINCCTRLEHIFTQEEIQIIQTFAVYIAVAIQNRKRFRELLALNEIGSELVKPFQLEKLYDHILEKAMEISGADRLCIKRYNERSSEITTIRSLNCEWHKQTKNTVRMLGEDFTSKTIKKGEPVIVPKYDIKSERLGNVPNQELFADTKSCLIMPIKIYGRVFGVLYLDSKRENAFNENDKLLLSTFSTQVAAAIRNANFFNKLQNVKETFPRISELNMDIHEVLEKIVETAAGVLDTDVLVLFRYDERAKKFILPPIYNGDIKHKGALEAEAIFLEVPLLLIKGGKSHYADHSQGDPIMTSKGKPLPKGIPGRFVIREKIVSSAGIILKVGKEIVGVMFINYRTPKEFNDDERHLIEIFASYIAISIQNVKHFKETKIKDTMQTVGKIASNFAHKMKNDIATIKLYADALIDGVKPDESQYLPLSKIMEQISKIRADIDHIEKASKLAIKGKMYIDMKEFINDLEVELLPDLGIRKIEFDLEIPPDIPKIEIDPIQIKMVLINLAQNSFDAMPEGGKISLSIFESGEALLLKWTDSGCGISPEDAPKVFDALWTKKKKGYGLGLFHAKAIMEEHRGSISVDIKYKGGARFLIEIPLRRENNEVKGE